MNETALLIAILGGSILLCCGFPKAPADGQPEPLACCYKDMKLCSREKELTSVAPTTNEVYNI